MYHIPKTESLSLWTETIDDFVTQIWSIHFLNHLKIKCASSADG